MSSAWPEQLWSDFRFAVRSLLRARGFTLTVLATLGVGIGTTTVIFNLTSWVVLRGLPYPHPEQLYYLGFAYPEGGRGYYEPGIYLRNYQQRTTTFSGFAAGHPLYSNVVVAGRALPDRVVEVSETFLAMTALQPVLGRGFRPEEFLKGHGDVVILTNAFWRKYFGSDPGVLGRTVSIEKQPCTIVGVFGANVVLPPNFRGDLFRPFVLSLDPKDPFSPYIVILGRLKPGVTPAQALADLSRIQINDLPAWAKAYFARNKAAMTLLSAVDRRNTWWMLLTAGALLYAIACLNAMNLLLIRFLERRRDLSIRFAVGGSRRQVMQLVVVEGLVLSIGACLVVVALAYWAFPPLFAAINGNESDDYPSFLNWRTVGCIGALSIFSCLVASAAPAFRLLRTDVNSGLKDGGAALGESRRTGRLRSAFVVFQAAFAVILLTATGLLVRSFDRMARIDLGFDPTNKVKVWIQIPAGIADKPEDWLALYERLQQRVALVPGVRRVSFGQDAVLPGGAWGNENVRLPDGTFKEAARTYIAADYPAVAGFALRAGRWFEDRKGTKEVVLNETIAKALFGTRNPVGELIVLQSDPATPLPVVGVARDVRDSIGANPGLRFYSSDTLVPQMIGTLLLQVQDDSVKGLTDQLRQAIYSVNDSVYMAGAQPLNRTVFNSKWAEHYASRILKGLSVIALGLTIVGIFSVIAYTVDSRKTEFGVRLALGETPGGLNRLVMRRGLTGAAVGVAVGLAGAAGLTRLMTSMLYDTSSFDGAVYGCVAVVLMLAAAAACWIPARRAAQVDANRLLRPD